MDTTFISIHDLSLDARLLYVSNSIGDILGYHPEEVVGKSCWEYFHPDEIPFAKAIHGRGVELDKAAVLNYCRIKGRDGAYVGCECCFTIVHDVLVGCTSIYRADPKAKQRAINAPIIRQIFSSSPKDPRYNMLSYISFKFSEGPQPHLREPRAALFLNRFTRTLTIMYATNGLEEVLGISSTELTGKSFYYCIQENCLAEAVRCLESAKANDSIAYLRFWYRDPRADDSSDHDEVMSDGTLSQSSSDDEGGVNLRIPDSAERVNSRGGRSTSSISTADDNTDGVPVNLASLSDGSSLTHMHSASSASASQGADPVFDRSRSRGFAAESSSSSISPANERRSRPQLENPEGTGPNQAVEVEAVVSCTSDGLVVILRGARPFVPDSVRAAPTASHAPAAQPAFRNGLFASPWAHEPVLPQSQLAQAYTQPLHHSQLTNAQVMTPGPRAQIPLPMPHSGLNTAGALRAVAGGDMAAPMMGDLMNTIREAAVFAWALTGINGSLAHYSHGKPAPGAQPYGGLPIWEGDAGMMEVDG